jgi:hypothetical protein
VTGRSCICDRDFRLASIHVQILQRQRSRALPLRAGCGLALLLPVVAAGCGGSGGQARVTPVYDKQTGALTELAGDRNGDGKVDARAYMNGVELKSIAIDRNGDGRPDRWEYYAPAPAGTRAPGSTAVGSLLVRADEANGQSDRVTRHEYYQHGVISRVEEDTNDDGRIDTWQTYENGTLVEMDLDLSGRGTPDRRLVYRADGTLDHVEADPDGDGKFERIKPGDALPPATTTPQKGGGR